MTLDLSTVLTEARLEPRLCFATLPALKVFMRALVGLGVGMAMATGLLVPMALAQKPPAPAPRPTPPPVSTPGGAAPASPVNGQPGTFPGDRVMLLDGKVATDDGTALPSNVMVERVCGTRVRQQVYANAHGDFSMQLGSTTDSVLLDASGDSDPGVGTQNQAGELGIPRRTLEDCEMRASASGVRSETVSLAGLDPTASRAEVGTIVVHRTAKVKGMTLNAAAYKAPKDARQAYEKGLDALRNNKIADARQHFEQAVKIYPRYAYAWFELGDVLRRQTQKDAAGAAYRKATAIDSKFLPPYLSLASLAFEAKDWTEVLGLTRYVLAHDSLDYGKVAGYLLDLDSLDYSEAYFYNAAANFELNRMEEAEKSGLQAERLDVRPRFPQLHLLLAAIFARKNNYVGAIDQLQMYLNLVPQGKNSDLAREHLAQMEKLKRVGPAGEKSEQN